MTGQMLTTPQVARLLGVSVRTVQRLARIGQLPCGKLAGETGAYVFDERDVLDYLESAKQAS